MENQRNGQQEHSQGSAASRAEAFRQELINSREFSFAHTIDPSDSRLTDVLRLFDRTIETSSTKTINSSVEDIEIDPPERIGRFAIFGILGAGGFGTVYHAHDDLLHREVALKAIRRRTRAQDATADGRFIEARAAARLSHPFLVSLHEVFQDEQGVYLVSEFCKGPTLAKWIADRPGPVPHTVVCDLIVRLTEGIMHVHDRGLVHRDIKPSNILLEETATASGQTILSPRLTDFGLVRDLLDESDFQTQGRLIGTLSYMSPEQVLSNEHAHGETCDIFSIGVLMYRLLTGELPHRGKDGLELLKAICVKSPPRPRILVAAVPRDLEAICMKCLAKDSALRYSSAADLKDDLIRWQQGRAVAARPQTRAERTWHTIARSPLESSLLAVIAVLVVIGVLALAHSNRKLAAERGSLQDALSEVQQKEQRAVAAERDASEHRDIAEKSQLAAVEAAYLSDLQQAYSSWIRRDPVKALSIATRVENYAAGVIPIGFDLQLLKSLAKKGWHNCPPLPTAISEIVLMPDSQSAAVVDESGTIRILRIDDGSMIREIPAVAGTRVFALAVSPDEKLLAVGRQVATDPQWRENRNEVEFISLSEKETLARMVDFPTTVESLAFSPDGKQIAVGCRYEPIEVFDLQTATRVATIDSFSRNRDLDFVIDANHLAFLNDNSSACVTNVSTGDTVAQRTTDEPIQQIAFSQDGRWLIRSFRFREFVHLFDLQSDATEPMILRQSFGIPESIAISSDGKRVVAGMRNGGIVGWELASHDVGKNQHSEHEPAVYEHSHFQIVHNGQVLTIAVDIQGQIVSGGEDGSVVISSGQTVQASPEHPQGKTLHAAFASGGDRAFLFCELPPLIVAIDTNTFRRTPIVGNYPLETGSSLAISPNGKWLAGGFKNGKYFVLSVKPLKPERFIDRPNIDTPRPAVIQTGFSKTSEQMFALSNNGYVLSRASLPLRESTGDAAGNQPNVQHKEFPVSIRVATMCGKDTFLLFSDHIASYNFSTDEVVVIDRPASAIRDVFNDFTKRQIYTTAQDSRLRSFDWNGQLLQTSDRWDSEQPSVTSLEPTCITMTPDRRSVVTGGNDGSIAIWNAEDLRFLGTIRAADQQGPITSIGFSDDGKVWMYHQGDTAGKFPQRGLQIVRIE